MHMANAHAHRSVIVVVVVAYAHRVLRSCHIDVAYADTVSSLFALSMWSHVACRMFGVVPVVPVVRFGVVLVRFGVAVVVLVVVVGLLVPYKLCFDAGSSPSVTSAPDREIS